MGIWIHRIWEPLEGRAKTTQNSWLSRSVCRHIAQKQQRHNFLLLLRLLEEVYFWKWSMPSWENSRHYRRQFVFPGKKPCLSVYYYYVEVRLMNKPYHEVWFARKLILKTEVFLLTVSLQTKLRIPPEPHRLKSLLELLAGPQTINKLLCSAPTLWILWEGSHVQHVCSSSECVYMCSAASCFCGVSFYLVAFLERPF